MTQIGSLVVDMGARITSFEANMDKAQRKLRSSQKNMNRSLKRMEGGFKKLSGAVKVFGAAFAGGLLARGFTSVASDAIKFGDTLAKQADRIGVSVEALQELRFAGERAGISFEQVDAGLIRFSKTLGELRAQTGTLFTLLNKTDPDLLNQLLGADTLDQGLDIILKKLPEIGTVMERNALASAAFGRQSGSAFGAAAESINPLRLKLRDIGAILSEELARKAEVVADKLTDLDVVLKTKLATTVLENIEGFVQFKTLMNDIAIVSVKAASAIGLMADALKDRLAGNINTFDVFVDRENALLEIDRLEARIEKRQNRIDGGLRPAIRNKALRDIKKHRQDIEKEREKIANFDRLLNQTRSTETELPGRKTKTPDTDDAGNGDTALAIPGTPSLSGFRLKQAEETKLLKAETDKLADAAERLAEKNRRVADSFQFAFENRAIDALLSGRIGDAVKGLGRDFAALALRLAIIQPLANSIFGGFSLPSFNFGGARALGGQVSPGKSFLVGEQGPELFTPSASGAITPNGALGGVNVTQSFHFDVGLESVEDRIRAAAPVAAAGAIDALERARNRPSFA